ncbi:MULTISPECIES: hypothetical protein [Rhizobium/Agrobacterium group]|uniref:hypothetical protein n=1 Tax=Rhizobium/Agrobacterium group TaxID=227290 RepID=UPI0008DBF225|nr:MULTISPECIES: hypothetical protein [Rhizobium/Agrobacterium group]MCF1436774.1 hypothetical protein [Allorhizobium ampelinum]MCF1464932.1 hypothetical protein [Allorhizobium ampelinum]MCF1495961.1 hypothetical protein [Allorhizobium ampelinum]MUO92141.1 hypothetical protein [Agrobacterium vitis]MUZ55463.1 hypothetical protein [Agrobacterium vitis]
MRLLLSACALLIAGETSAAQSTVRGVVENAKTDEIRRTFIVGIARGIEAANVALGSQQRPLLYCPPPKLEVTPDQWLRILEVYLDSRPEDANRSVATMNIVLLWAAAEAFPCH